MTLTSGGLEGGIQLSQGNMGPDRPEHSRLIALSQMQPRLSAGLHGCTTARGAILIPVGPGDPKRAGDMNMCMCPVIPVGSGQGCSVASSAPHSRVLACG